MNFPGGVSAILSVEIAALDGGGFGGVWLRTGGYQYFATGRTSTAPPRRAAGIREAILSAASHTAIGRSLIHLHRSPHGPPARVSAVHVFRVEARLAQLDRGLAADVEAVRAVHDHRF